MNHKQVSENEQGSWLTPGKGDEMINPGGEVEDLDYHGVKMETLAQHPGERHQVEIVQHDGRELTLRLLPVERRGVRSLSE